MSDPLVLVDQSRRYVSILSLNRPDKRNALNIPLIEALIEAIDAVHSDPDQRVLVLRGEGSVFCAGLDLKEATDPDRAERSSACLSRVLELVRDSPLVTIAVVQGAAIAGGAGLMLACDLAIATRDMRSGFPEVRRGMVAGLVMTFIRRKLGENNARKLLLLGALVDAEEAHRMGMVTQVVDAADLEEAALVMAETVLKGAPGAIAHSKELLDELWHQSTAEDLKRALAYHKTARTSEESQEGFAAFLEKRDPDWDPAAHGHIKDQEKNRE